MARQTPITTLVCTVEGCRERVHYSYANLSEQREATRLRRGEKFLCSRHRKPEEVLAPDNLTREIVHESKWGEGTYIQDKLFWAIDGGKPSNGFLFGPGFKAYAADFPLGTKVIVTARVVLPDEV